MNSGMMNSGNTDTPEVVNPQQNDCNASLNIVRIRYFYEFKTPFCLNCKKEVLFYNTSDSSTEKIEFDLGGFRKHLHIYDSNNKSLEFHKKIEEYSSSAPQEDISVIIEIPSKIKSHKYGTVVFDYIEEISNYNEPNMHYSIFEFNLSESPRTYISINSHTRFKLIKHYFIKDTAGSLFLPEELDESDDVQIEPNDFSVYLIAGRKIDGCSVLFAFRYELEKYQQMWLNLG
ncbi:MAG: hypothetical protein WC362_08070, partial [Methanoregula sp.]